MKLLGIKFTEQTPESFWQYCKDIAKHQGIKRPEASKPKLKKAKKTKNGKHDTDSRPITSTDNSGKTKEDVRIIQEGGWAGSDSHKFFFPVSDK